MSDHPIEKRVETLSYRGVALEVVERPDVLWVGCAKYADNNREEPNMDATLKRYREELIGVPKRNLIHPDWSAALLINYERADRPCGILLAQETYTPDQDARYDLFTQPGGLWLRLRNDKKAAALLGRESADPYAYIAGGILRNVAKENGYAQNPCVPVQVAYHCHAEYKTPPHTNYAYIPVEKA